jgi:cation diffusion facilitator CzcD-associated flavoprotein CzcO
MVLISKPAAARIQKIGSFSQLKKREVGEMKSIDCAIVGAGPYGLSAAAHLRAANGLEVRVFGETMAFWERYMPMGMLLRSPWEGSHIADPKRVLTLDAYRLASDNHLAAPVPLDRFIQYGHWFQQQAVPDIDPRKVTRVEDDSAGFRVTLEDGEAWKSRRVIVAAGIAAFAWRPSEFAGLPLSLVSHTSDHRDLGRFAGQKVLVLGGGQSALESAALLHESGAEVEIVVRTPMVRWLWPRPWLHTCKPVARLLYAPPDVGPAGVSHLVARPDLYRRFPRGVQDRLGVRSIRPAGAAWLKPRLEKVPITTGRTVVSAVPAGERLTVKLNDGSDRRVDHVLLGTGYRADISRYAFLAEGLLISVRQINGFPCLDAGFESSVPGLHFLGAPAAWSFGPLMRFVAGTEFASRALTRRILGKADLRRS